MSQTQSGVNGKHGATRKRRVVEDFGGSQGGTRKKSRVMHESPRIDWHEARANIKIESELQSRKKVVRSGVFIPDWAIAITPNDAEQKLLGYIDYWLGIAGIVKVDDEERVQLRAGGSFLYVEQDGTAWYTVTARRLGRDLNKGKKQVYGIVRRLLKKGFLVAGRFERLNLQAALYLSLNWAKIETAYQQAVDSCVEEVEEDDE